MQKKNAYLLYGYFGAGNFGDDVLLRAGLEYIAKADPDAVFIVRNCGSLDFLSDFQNRVIAADFEAAHRSGHALPVKFLMLLKEYWRMTGRCGTLVIGGGTLIHDRPYLMATFLLTCLAVIAKMRGCRVVGIGLGLKTIHTRAGKCTLALLLRLFDEINLRDAESFRQCREACRGKTSLHLTSDLAYALDWNIAPGDKGRVIAVSLVEYIFCGDRHRDQMKILARTLESLIREGFSIRLLSLQKPGDRQALETLRQELPEVCRAACSVADLEANPDSILAAYRGVELMIGMRFHSLVFAVLAGIPFVGLGHEPKIAALAREFSMPVVPLDGFSPDVLKSAVETGLARHIDETIVADCVARARRNFRFFAKES